MLENMPLMQRIRWGTASTPEQFIRKWTAAKLSERSAAQQHFLDLCALVGEPTPAKLEETDDPPMPTRLGFYAAYRHGHCR